MAFIIEIANQQQRLALDEAKIRVAVTAALTYGGYACGELSVAVVDDPTIHEVNRAFLEHDYPTDVISFPLNDPAAEADGHVEGEIVVSTDTAAAQAHRLAFPGWNTEEEFYLYLIHGALHLAGFDDHTEDDLREMRDAEVAVLAKIGITAPDGLHDRD